MKRLLVVIFLLTPLMAISQKGDFWQIDFRLADSLAFKYGGYSLRHPDRLTDSLVQGLNTDVEKFRAIYRWITDNIAYDGQLYHRIVKTRQKFHHDKKKSSILASRISKKGFRRMIRQKKAVCAGYATLLDYMCEQAGIQSVFIGGYARNYGTDFPGPNHAWNAVRLNGKWYLCDVTWASGSYDNDVKRFRKHYSNTYFLTEPDLFMANHYPSDVRWTLLKDPPSLTEFLDAPLKLEGFLTNKINRHSPVKGVIRIVKTEPFLVTFTSNANRIQENVRLIIRKRSDKKFEENIDVPVTQNKTGEFMVKYSFQAKGTYYVYLYVNEKQTMAYQVIVL